MKIFALVEGEFYNEDFFLGDLRRAKLEGPSGANCDHGRIVSVMSCPLVPFNVIQERITEAAEEYKDSQVANYLDDLYIRLNESPGKVLLAEILYVSCLKENGLWSKPALAQNQLLHLFHNIGRDTTGVSDH